MVKTALEISWIIFFSLSNNGFFLQFIFLFCGESWKAEVNLVPFFFFFFFGLCLLSEFLFNYVKILFFFKIRHNGNATIFQPDLERESNFAWQRESKDVFFFFATCESSRILKLTLAALLLGKDENFAAFVCNIKT